MRDTVLGSTYVLGGLRYPEERLLELYMKLDRILEDSTTYQGLLRRGAIQEAQQTVLDMGAERFGAAPPAIEARVKAFNDLLILRTLRNRVLNATSWDELLGDG